MKIPEGYLEIESLEDYRVRADDKIYSYCCGWRDDREMIDYLGLTANRYKEVTSCEKIKYFRKGVVKPRFESKFPFPYGY